METWTHRAVMVVVGRMEHLSTRYADPAAECRRLARVWAWVRDRHRRMTGAER